MRSFSAVKAMVAAAALTLLAGCSNDSAIAPDMSSTVKLHQFAPVSRTASFDNCPTSGTIEYVSDFQASTISILVGNWNQGSKPCGMLTSTSGLSGPWALTVHDHNLYVANNGAGDVIAFHRGATTSFATFVDHTGGGEFPFDVAVQKDNTVIATNVGSVMGSAGSISTWTANGTLVGNFVNPRGYQDNYVTVQRNGKVYFDDSGLELNVGKCPLGACGTFTNTGATGFGVAGPLRSASYVKTGLDTAVLLEDVEPVAGESVLDTFTSFPGPPSVSCFWPTDSSVLGFDINRTNHHVYGVVPDSDFAEGIEMTYPGCAVKGVFFPDGAGPDLTGVAIDRPGALD
jgi:hypothetical protein